MHQGTRGTGAVLLHLHLPYPLLLTLPSIRLLGTLIALAILASGCSHTRTHHLDSDHRADVNARASRGKAVVTLRSGVQVTSSTLRLDSQTASWTDPESGEAFEVPLEEVATVRVRDPRSFVLRDLGIGLAAGVVAGYVHGSLSEPSILFPRETLQQMGVGAGALLGTGIGALVGFEQGRAEYVITAGFPPPRPSSGGG